MPARMSVYETQGRQIAACMEYGRTGDQHAIEVYLGVDGTGAEVIGTLACDDYAEDVAMEPAFRAWYARVSQILGIDNDPDDARHCYDYRGFYREMLAGKFKSPAKRGDRLRARWEKPCHDRT